MLIKPEEAVLQVGQNSLCHGVAKKKKEVRQKVLIDKQDTVRWGGVSDCPATGRTWAIITDFSFP